MEPLEGTVLPQKKPRRVKPSIRQIRALQYKNQGMSTRQAMIKAGYSKNSSGQPGRLLYGTGGVKQILDSMAGELNDAGLTTKYMVGKFKEWMEAEKVHTSHTEPDRTVPDYDVQLKAYDRWEKVMTPKDIGGGKVKRKLTIEEFVTGGK